MPDNWFNKLSHKEKQSFCDSFYYFMEEFVL